jgi:16S rRNA processing protein RimM
MIPPADRPRIAAGRIIKPFGVKGWVRVSSMSSNPERFKPGNSFMLEGAESRPRLSIESSENRQGGIVVKFEGIDDRDAAAKLGGKLLLLEPEELGAAPEDSFWEHELLGLSVKTAEGIELGKVAEVMETGANDVLVVRGHGEHLVPLIEEVVKRVDLENRVMIIEAVPGLLEE